MRGPLLDSHRIPISHFNLSCNVTSENFHTEDEKVQRHMITLPETATRDKGHNGNLVMFKNQNTRRLTLCRFWTSRRPMVHIKRKCIDLGHKEHGFHEVTWSASNHKKSVKLIGFSSDSEIT
ncbi:hypothetical protein PIB30_026231 [Stylosanthes scabra]|uniref:Uncharacterized protein n=1 Tax=Stylosanthes scabra TaxID=79078 RepID=A0ABU6QBP1_9FABA|nr:hypothetical protein [Stylosanthes scabra]